MRHRSSQVNLSAIFAGCVSIHLTEKPLQLMRDVVKIVEPGGHILDPFAGSGPTVLAAVQEGYTATGIEVTDTYAELARERIRKELACAA